MPTYEYHCDACEYDFEDFHSMTEEAHKKCPKCGKLKLRRLFGAGAAIIFKGSGFYQTDYRSESYKTAAKAESDSSKPATDDKSATTGKTDAASAPKTEKTESSPKKASKSKSRASDE